MANTKGVANYRNPLCPGKPSFLPPRSPFPSISPAYADHVGPKGSHKPREGHNRHQRTSSESFIFEEQPSWLDDLLNEPETPVKKGSHRRSSSDSFAYLDASSISSKIEDVAREELRDRSFGRLQELSHGKTMQYPSYCAGMNSLGRPQNRGREPVLNSMALPSSLPPTKDMVVIQQGPTSYDAIREADSLMCTLTKKNEEEESATQDPKGLSEKKEDPSSDHSQTEADPKRVKQKFAQRSRVRKLQYIAELERNCQALQAGGCEVSAELEFLDQQNIILNLENTALKQRLDSLAQEKYIKHLQQEMLEREIARLRALHQQQQLNQHHLQEQPIATHGRSRSRDLDAHFANLSLKHREGNPTRDPVTGPLRI
ncbi:unnamed protein product [Spirodela intermedia]|uniref:BZIP domain-containing protein n=1 Tax=Spirodela intermedia TaxID=51605 RepID=A0A7I8KRJ8_SPIIN|nr:unnamed protein product [Spirodela intermedia]